MKLFSFLFSVIFLFGSQLSLSDDKLVPDFRKLKTKTGADVFFFPNPNVPLFEVRIVFDGVGSAYDPDGMSGLTSITTAMLKKGVRGMDENTISQKLDDIAAGIDFGVADDQVSVNIFGLNEHVEQVLAMTKLFMTEPNFPEKPFVRIRNSHIDALNQLSDHAADLAGRALSLGLLNGTTKSRPGDGLREDLMRLTVADLAKHSEKIFRTDRMHVLVIGGKDTSEIAGKVISYLDSFSCRRCETADVALKKRTFSKWVIDPKKVVVLNRPGITEAHLQMGFLAPPRKNPEFYELRLAETILSGYFASRMNMIIREKLNLTYGISAGFDFDDDLGIFNVSTSTRNSRIGELLLAVNSLLNDFVKNGVSEEELRGAQNFLQGSFPISLQNKYIIAQQYFSGILRGLDSEFIDAFTSRLGRVDVAHFNSAVKKHFSLDQMRTIISGDLKEIGPVLKKAGIDFEVRDAKDFL